MQFRSIPAHIDNGHRWIGIFRRSDIYNAVCNLRRMCHPRKVSDSTGLASRVDTGMHLLHGDILRRSYNDNDSRNLVRNDSGDTDVRKSDPGIQDGRHIRRLRDRKSCFRSSFPGISLCIPFRTILLCRVASNRGPPSPWRRHNFRSWDHTNYYSCIRNASDNPCRKDPPGILFRIESLASLPCSCNAR